MADGNQAGTAEALARYYDLDLEDDAADVEMYLAFAAASKGPVLELMCGTGRVAVPLAQAGQRVVGVDRDGAALRRAATRWQLVKDRALKGGILELVEADVGELHLEDRFGLVIVALNGVVLLDGRAAQREIFDTIARHLAPGGRVIIDVWLPAPDDLALYDGRLVLDWLKRDDETGELVAKLTSARYEPATRAAQITSFFDTWHDGQPWRRTTRTDTINFVSADELARYAEDAGLDLETIAGDYEMGQFAGDSERVVMVCRARCG